jgi:hypothetical protein
LAFEAEGDPAVTFEPVNLVTRTTSELWILVGLLVGRGMIEHALAVAKCAAARRSATDRSQS